MTTLAERHVGTAARLRRPRRATPATPATPAVPDVHAQLIAESNRLLEAAHTTEMTARDALGELVGALINLQWGPGGVSESDLVDLVRRKADSLGCPPAAPMQTRRAR